MPFRPFKAVAATFAYLAEHWPVLLKAMWLPALFVAGLQLYAAPAVFSGLADMALLGPNPEPEQAAAAMGTLSGGMLFVLIAGLIFFPMLMVASLKHIVRGEDQRLPFHLSYGADETRIMAANFLFNLMIVVIAVVGEIVVGVIAAIFLLFGPAVGGLVKSLAALGVNLATAWFNARMSPLFPAVMATRSLGVGHAFAATARDWLPVIGFWLLIGGVVIPVILVSLWPAFGPLLGDLGAMRRGDAQEAAAILQALAAATTPSAPQFPLIAAGLYLMTLVVNAVVNTASAVVWRYLSAPREDAAA